MADNDTNLPEGTDSIIGGASDSPGASPSGGGTAPELRGTGTGTTGSQSTGGSSTLVADRPEKASGVGANGGSGKFSDKLRSGKDRLSGQAADKARGLVGQGLERGSEALANVGRMIGDTATGLDERLGEEYGNYARRAASAIENTANSLASKDADELIDDTRNFVRKSPAVALAGAAVVGFVLARLVKSGLDSGDDDDRPGEGDGRTGA